MRKLTLFLLLLGFTASSQVRRPVLDDSLFSTYYHQRLTLFKTLRQTAGDIIFLGNSITDGGEWGELFDDLRVKNRGISGDISAGLIHRIDEIVQRKPSKIFLLIGVNDLARNVPPDSVVKNVLWIASFVRKESPSTRLYVQSILPVNSGFGKFEGHTGKVNEIKQVNARLAQEASSNHYTYIDLYTRFSDNEGGLKAYLTNDGLHLKGDGYVLWKHLLYPYVFDLEEKPSLLPLPQQLQWKVGYFPLYKARTILVQDTILEKEARRLASELAQRGQFFKVIHQVIQDEPYIELKLAGADVPHSSEESYRLEASPGKIQVEANSPHGIFYGIQTLLQLARDRVMIDACVITDWPAFSWRAYMVDVGRNFQSVSMLKQQIDMMAKYKLNVFHFHLTEDIAWRLQVHGYPQLTAPENMLRDKGAFYSVKEMKDLIGYCKERYITLVPEIDMPGHSAAFTRAMGVDMQSEKGKEIVKKILTDFCATYNLLYLHIGGDEVKITDKGFLPAVTSLVHNLGKQTIGWDPGGNLDKKTIRQLWMRDGAVLKDHRYIDSRHLYINHMDPLESVTTIFARKIGDRAAGDSSVLGGAICLWHDRIVQDQTDLLIMNPVYPAMLAFAERIWQGGGWDKWISNLDPKNKKQLKDFRDFEHRMLGQRSVFTGIPFPYAAQSDIKWKLIGPYNNDGDVSKKFAPEQRAFTLPKDALDAVGGTVVLRHFWDPLVKGVLEKPAENTTWYASTQIWSDTDTTASFWIGFNNLSRSYNSDSPPEGKWDNRGSMVFVNGQMIAPPQWKRAGQKGNPEIPLVDEGYEYRDPAMVRLTKGWNRILVKFPVADFKGHDWKNPVKWMFTFCPLTSQMSYNE